MKCCIVWLRRDLRLADNPALARAVAEAEQVIPVFVHAPEEESPWAPGAASRWWLHHSLSALDRDLRERGSGLVIRSGPTLEALQRLVRETGAEAVYWNRLYEPATAGRDRSVKEALRASGIAAESCKAVLLFEPWEIRTSQGTPYRVFTPFWRACLARLDELAPPERAPRRIVTPPVRTSGVDALELLPRIHWHRGLEQTWRVGEAAAQACLAHFLELRLAKYPDDRNRLEIAGSSRLSPHLHFGEIGPRQVLATILQSVGGEARAGGQRGADTFLKEIGWREFAHHLLFHFPHTAERALDERFESFAWLHDERQLAAWQRGRTGIPIVDAGMRELWATGWMHNRVRMIVASFLTKNLRIDWRAGARWFWDTLVDADLANNTLGWQWTAGCGADAAPFVRIFNPVAQSERFDPDGAYVRRWVPELATVADDFLHAPWRADAETLGRAGFVPGETYPHPLVDLAQSRGEALSAYASLRASASRTRS